MYIKKRGDFEKNAIFFIELQRNEGRGKKWILFLVRRINEIKKYLIGILSGNFKIDTGLQGCEYCVVFLFWVQGNYFSWPVDGEKHNNGNFLITKN